MAETKTPRKSISRSIRHTGKELSSSRIRVESSVPFMAEESWFVVFKKVLFKHQASHQHQEKRTPESNVRILRLLIFTATDLKHNSCSNAMGSQNCSPRDRDLQGQSEKKSVKQQRQ